MTRARLTGLPAVIALVWVVRTVSALIIAYPISQALMGTGLDRFEDGDQRAFEAGGWLLVEALRVGRSTLAAVARSGVILTLVLLAIQLLPLGALIASVQDRSANLAACLLRSIRAFPALTVLSALTLLVQALWLLLCVSVLGSLVDPLRSATDERTADYLLLGGAAAGVFGCALLGVVLDLARTRVIARGITGLAAITPSAAVFFSHPVRSSLGWATPTVWALVVTGVCAAVVSELDVSAPGTWRVLAVFKARWLASASQLTAGEASPAH